MRYVVVDLHSFSFGQQTDACVQDKAELGKSWSGYLEIQTRYLSMLFQLCWKV